MTNRPKYDPAMLALAVITLALSTWGLYRLAHGFGHVPTPLAVCAVAGFDLFAVAAGRHALRLATDRDSPGVWNLAVVGTAVASSGLQYETAHLFAEPVAVGLMFAVFPLATVALFEGTLRRAHRLAGRKSGQTSQPRASFELIHWVMYPRRTWGALRYAVLDRKVSADEAMQQGWLLAEEGLPVEQAPARQGPALDWADILSGRASMPGARELPAGHAGEEDPGSPGMPGGLHAVPPGRRPGIAAAVRAAFADCGNDLPAVIGHVQASGVPAGHDSIRRELARQVARMPAGQETG